MVGHTDDVTAEYISYVVRFPLADYTMYTVNVNQAKVRNYKGLYYCYSIQYHINPGC